MKKVAFAFGAVLILGLLFHYFSYFSKETGNEEFATKFSEAFVDKYVQLTYGSDAKNIVQHLDQWKYENGHYILNISAGWDGGCCSFIHYVTCGVKVKLKVIVDKQGNIYDYTVADKNACALEHEVSGVAFKSAATMAELGIRLKETFDSENK